MTPSGTTRYRFPNGQVILASSPEEFVEKMRENSLAYVPTDEEYMQDCSDRAAKLGIDIRADNPYNFLEDMLAEEQVFVEVRPAEWN